MPTTIPVLDLYPFIRPRKPARKAHVVWIVVAMKRETMENRQTPRIFSHDGTLVLDYTNRITNRALTTAKSTQTPINDPGRFETLDNGASTKDYYQQGRSKTEIHGQQITP